MATLLRKGCRCPYAAQLRALPRGARQVHGVRRPLCPYVRGLGKRTRLRGPAGRRWWWGTPTAPVTVGWGKGGRSERQAKQEQSRAVRANERSAAGFRGLLPDTFDTGGLRRGGEGAAARRPVPAIPVPSGAVFGGRNGSCCGKRPPVWCCCSSAEPELWEPLSPRRAPPPLSDAPASLRGAAPPRPRPRPRPRPAPGARSKLSDMLRPGRLKRSWEGAGDGRGGRLGRGGAAWCRLAAARALHFQFHPRPQRHDGRGRARLTAPPRGSAAPVAIATSARGRRRQQEERGPRAASAPPRRGSPGRVSAAAAAAGKAGGRPSAGLGAALRTSRIPN